MTDPLIKEIRRVDRPRWPDTGPLHFWRAPTWAESEQAEAAGNPAP